MKGRLLWGTDAGAGGCEVAPDVAAFRTVMANVFFVGPPGRDGWVLVDAGFGRCARPILKAAEARFGPGARPEAILLTHGHFDHVGGLPELVHRWRVPVYTHELEMPYLTGRSLYPPPDPTVGGGAMARLSPLYPRGSKDPHGLIHALPSDCSVPGLSGWQWIATPGHTAGHVSFYREADRVLIAGDAVITVKQESAAAVLAQSPEVHGPPAYFTQDWSAAADSVRRLAVLRPDVLATGHGLPLRGERMRRELDALARNFESWAVPRSGRYVDEPALADERGVIYIPPPVPDPVPTLLAGAAVVAAGAAAYSLVRRRSA